MGIWKTLIRFQKDFGFIVIVGIKRKYMTALQNSTRSASKAPSARLGSSLQNRFFNLTKAQGKLGLFLISKQGVFSLKINLQNLLLTYWQSNLPSNKVNDKIIKTKIHKNKNHIGMHRYFKSAYKNKNIKNISRKMCHLSIHPLPFRYDFDSCSNR